MWARLIAVAIGAFFRASPGVFGYGGAAAINDHVVGPIIVGSSFAAAWPATRSLRWVELPAGAWMFVAPIILEYTQSGNTLPDVIHVCGGLAVAILAVTGGKTRESFGGGWASVLPFVKREARDEL